MRTGKTAGRPAALLQPGNIDERNPFYYNMSLVTGQRGQPLRVVLFSVKGRTAKKNQTNS